jgi:hypothetical protein
MAIKTRKTMLYDSPDFYLQMLEGQPPRKVHGGRNEQMFRESNGAQWEGLLRRLERELS